MKGKKRKVEDKKEHKYNDLKLKGNILRFKKNNSLN